MKLLIFLLIISSTVSGQNNIIVFQSDFGQKDGAVSAMKGVAMSVSDELKLHDLTHDIPAYNIWEASFRLQQTLSYWPKGTVFVSVVDPGVGTDRKSVVVRTVSGHFIVTPDNGTLTHIAATPGIEAVREINEAVNRRARSEGSYTFHGRDVYAYTAARLASGTITFEQVGNELSGKVVTLSFQPPAIQANTLKGNIPILDVQYGNVWTNIPHDLVEKCGMKPGDQLKVSILKNGRHMYSGKMPFKETFSTVERGKPLAYLNSLMQLSFALNQGSFAEKFKISSGHEWSVEVTKADQ
jgi:S-adenosylmethionine hydrolase